MAHDTKKQSHHTTKRAEARHARPPRTSLSAAIAPATSTVPTSNASAPQNNSSHSAHSNNSFNSQRPTTPDNDPEFNESQPEYALALQQLNDPRRLSLHNLQKQSCKSGDSSDEEEYSVEEDTPDAFRRRVNSLSPPPSRRGTNAADLSRPEGTNANQNEAGSWLQKTFCCCGPTRNR